MSFLPNKNEEHTYDDKKSNVSTVKVILSGKRSTESRDAGELLALRHLRAAETDVEIQNDLEGVSASQVRKWCLCLLQTGCRLEATTGTKLMFLTRKRKKAL
jgi:hypothetical protein